MREEVTEDILVFRLVSSKICKYADGEWILTSPAFGNNRPRTADAPDDEMSVVLEHKLNELNRKPENLPADTAWTDETYGVAKIPAAYLRDEEEQTIYFTPLDIEPAHGDVVGEKDKSRRKSIREHAEWVIPPPPKLEGT